MGKQTKRNHNKKKEVLNFSNLSNVFILICVFKNQKGTIYKIEI
jgi:hypothetical protein